MSLSIPCVLMRAGTSRGPFFLREWLPIEQTAFDSALIDAIGAADAIQVDGLGGGSSLTSKVAIVSKSAQPGCDVDYLFAQVSLGERRVDYRPNCGNMLSGVGAFAIEQGLVVAGSERTTLRVFNVNTRSRIELTLETPAGRVRYDGDTRIDGVSRPGAPVLLSFLDAWGATTGSVFPTGARSERIDGIEVTCIDAAIPLMIVRAHQLGLSGSESAQELDSTDGLLTTLEQLRIEAGRRMGLGDVRNSVIPKPVVVSEGSCADSVTSRYFTPKRCHSSHAVTGAIGVSTAFCTPGTVAYRERATDRNCRTVNVQHPSGSIAISIELEGAGESRCVTSASVVRTVRKIFEGTLYLPNYVL